MRIAREDLRKRRVDPGVALGRRVPADPTHRNPLPPAVLQFLVRQRGFVDAEIVRLHPFPDDHLLPQDDVIGQRLNQLLYGPQDYAVVARRV